MSRPNKRKNEEEELKPQKVTKIELEEIVSNHLYESNGIPVAEPIDELLILDVDSRDESKKDSSYANNFIAVEPTAPREAVLDKLKAFIEKSKSMFKGYTLTRLFSDNYYKNLSRRQLSSMLQEPVMGIPLWMKLFAEPGGADLVFSVLDELPITEQAKLLLQNTSMIKIKITSIVEMDDLKIEFLRRINRLPSGDKVAFYQHFKKFSDGPQFLAEQNTQVQFYFSVFAVEVMKQKFFEVDKNKLSKPWFDSLADIVAKINAVKNPSAQMDALGYRWNLCIRELTKLEPTLLVLNKDPEFKSVAWPFELCPLEILAIDDIKSEIEKLVENYSGPFSQNFDKELLAKFFDEEMGISKDEAISFRMHWIKYIEDLKSTSLINIKTKKSLGLGTNEDNRDLAIYEALLGLMYAKNKDELDGLFSPELIAKETKPADDLEKLLSYYIKDKDVAFHKSSILDCFDKLKELNDEEQSRILNLKFDNLTVAEYLSQGFEDSDNWNSLIDQVSDVTTRQNALQVLEAIWQHLSLQEREKSIDSLLVERKSDKDQQRLKQLVSQADFWHITLNGWLREASPDVFEVFMQRVVEPFEKSIPDELKQTINDYRAQQELYPLLQEIQPYSQKWDNDFAKRLRLPIKPPDTPSIEELAGLFSAVELPSNDAIKSQLIIRFLSKMDKDNQEKFLNGNPLLLHLVSRDEDVNAINQLIGIMDTLPNLYRKNLVYNIFFDTNYKPVNAEFGKSLNKLINELSDKDKIGILKTALLPRLASNNSDYFFNILASMESLPNKDKQVIYERFVGNYHIKILTEAQIIALFKFVIQLDASAEKTAFLRDLLSRFCDLAGSFDVRCTKEGQSELIRLIKQLHKKEQTSILTLNDFGRLSGTSIRFIPRYREYLAEFFIGLLDLTRQLPIEDQAKCLPNFVKDGNIYPTVGARLDHALILLAKKAYEFKEKADINLQKKQTHALNNNIRYFHDAKQLYEQCDELIHRDYFDAVEWDRVISTAKRNFSHDSSMLGLIKIIDTDQRAIQREFIAQDLRDKFQSIPDNTNVLDTSTPIQFGLTRDVLKKTRQSSIDTQKNYLQFYNNDYSRRVLETLFKQDSAASRDYYLIKLAVLQNDKLEKLRKQLILLTDEWDREINTTPKNLKLLNKIPFFWDDCIAQARNSSVISATENQILTKLAQSKPKLDNLDSTPVVTPKKNSFFKQHKPVDNASPKSKTSGHNIITRAIYQSRGVLDDKYKITRDSLMAFTGENAWPNTKNPLRAAIEENTVDMLLKIVPLYYTLCTEYDRKLTLSSCNSLLNQSTLDGFANYPDKMSDLCQLELDRIIFSLEKKAPESRLLKTMKGLKAELLRPHADRALLDIQDKLKKETSWSTWFGVSKTTTARRDADRLLSTLLVLEYKQSSNRNSKDNLGLNQ